MSIYRIDDGNGDSISQGIQGLDAARRLAREVAAERGESVWVSPQHARVDEDGEYVDDSEEVTP